MVRGATRHRSRALRGDAPEGETSRDGDGVLRSGAAAGQTHGSHPRARLVVAERSRSLRLYVVRERRGDVSHRVGRPERRRDGRQLRGRREHRDHPGHRRRYLRQARRRRRGSERRVRLHANAKLRAPAGPLSVRRRSSESPRRRQQVQAHRLRRGRLVG